MPFVPRELTCLVCGAEFRQYRYGQKYCSPECRSKRKNPAWNRAGSVAARRRRRLRHATTWDGVTDAEILERDRWTCGICRRRIGKTFRYPHPRSASVDHILPLSLGGDDTALNKRAAHLGCNVSRSAGKPGEQLPLPFAAGEILAPRPPKPRVPRPRKARLCLVCGEPAVGVCELHMLVWFPVCDHCGSPFASQSPGKRVCGACVREEKRRRDRERMQRLRATPEGREHILEIKQRHADRQFDAWVRQNRENSGGLRRLEAAPVEGAQGRGSLSLRLALLAGHP